MTDDPPFDLLLLDRHRFGELTPDERVRVETWLQQHPDTARLLRELPLAAQVSAPAADTSESWRLLEARIRASETAPNPGVRHAPVVRISAGIRTTPWLRKVTAAAAAVVVIVGGVATWRDTRGGSLEAPIGTDVTATLPDGSRLTLSAGSRATWSASFGNHSRDISLTGQGLFDVVHDATRPFRVHTRDAVAEDVGTRFVVRAWPELAAVVVAVEEGLVALTDTLRPRSASATVLRAGQLGRLDADGTVSVAGDSAAAMAWARGELVFENSPLSEVLPAVSRRYGVDLRADPALADRRLSARVAAQSLPELLNALAVSLDVRVETRGRVTTLLPASP